MVFEQCRNSVEMESYNLAEVLMGPALLSGNKCFVISVPDIFKLVCLKCLRAPMLAF